MDPSCLKYALTDEESEHFEREGYLVVEDALPPKMVDEYLKVISWTTNASSTTRTPTGGCSTSSKPVSKAMSRRQISWARTRRSSISWTTKAASRPHHQQLRLLIAQGRRCSVKNLARTAPAGDRGALERLVGQKSIQHVSGDAGDVVFVRVVRETRTPGNRSDGEYRAAPIGLEE